MAPAETGRRIDPTIVAVKIARRCQDCGVIPVGDGDDEHEGGAAEDQQPLEGGRHRRRIYGRGWGFALSEGVREASFRRVRRRGQVVRQETANLPFVGSIPTGASAGKC
jgi:hypothetical protein